MVEFVGFSRPERMDSNHRSPLPEGPFDLAVIGGGINGAAIARDAILRGLTVCLLEKGDFAGGTSSRTSKMIHGGIRYLEQLQFGLVFEALRERALLLSLAPHLVRPQSFVIPIYRGARRGPRWIKLGLTLYDALAIGRRIAPARMLGPAEAVAMVPGLRGGDLAAAGVYHDGVMDDARLCLANVLDAREAGGGRFFFRNHTEVLERRPTAPISLAVRDRITGRESVLLSHRVVKAVGPWTDLDGQAEPILIPSKGIHIVLPAIEDLVPGPRPSGNQGLLLTHAGDGRVFFVIPWLGRTLVGTTETPWTGDPDQVKVESGEVLYLAEEFRRMFPQARLGPRDILGTFAGVRPLARGGGLFRDVARASRRHRIADDRHGTLTVVGGKFTTFRAVARDVMDRIRPGTSCGTARRPFPGGEQGPWEGYRDREGRQWIERFGEDTVRTLFERYGSRLGEVLQPALSDPRLAEPIGPGVIRAEARHAVERESVWYPEDFLERRTTLRYHQGGGREAYPVIEDEIRRFAGSAAPPDLDAARERYFARLEEEDRLRNVLAVPPRT
jgi:glycerol-3-phosphate dehydrogenase